MLLAEDTVSTITSATDLLGVFKALFATACAGTVSFFGLWQYEVRARAADKDAQLARLRELLAQYTGGRKESHGDVA